MLFVHASRLDGSSRTLRPNCWPSTPNYWCSLASNAASHRAILLHRRSTNCHAETTASSRTRDSTRTARLGPSAQLPVAGTRGGDRISPADVGGVTTQGRRRRGGDARHTACVPTLWAADALPRHAAGIMAG